MRTRQQEITNAEAKEKQQLDSDQSQSIRHQPTYLEVFRSEESEAWPDGVQPKR